MKDTKKNTCNGNYTHCPTNAYDNCPYCDPYGICHVETDWDASFDWRAASDEIMVLAMDDMG